MYVSGTRADILASNDHSLAFHDLQMWIDGPAILRGTLISHHPYWSSYLPGIIIHFHSKIYTLYWSDVIFDQYIFVYFLNRPNLWGVGGQFGKSPTFGPLSAPFPELNFWYWYIFLISTFIFYLDIYLLSWYIFLILSCSSLLPKGLTSPTTPHFSTCAHFLTETLSLSLSDIIISIYAQFLTKTLSLSPPTSSSPDMHTFSLKHFHFPFRHLLMCTLFH